VLGGKSFSDIFLDRDELKNGPHCSLKIGAPKVMAIDCQGQPCKVSPQTTPAILHLFNVEKRSFSELFLFRAGF